MSPLVIAPSSSIGHAVTVLGPRRAVARQRPDLEMDFAPGQPGQRQSARQLRLSPHVQPDRSDPDTAVITGRWTSDNGATDILINGTRTGINYDGNFGTFSGNWTISSGFIDGTNTLDFVINNAGTTVNPTGFRAELSPARRTHRSRPARRPPSPRTRNP